MNEDLTTQKTLWTETSFEMLYAALETNKSDAKVKEILVGLRGKNIKPIYLINKVRGKVGDDAAKRLEGILRRKAPEKAGKATKKGTGLVSRILTIFQK